MMMNCGNGRCEGGNYKELPAAQCSLSRDPLAGAPSQFVGTQSGKCFVCNWQINLGKMPIAQIWLSWQTQ